MTELFDLSTLASLGEHFSTLEESTVVKTDVIRLQEELNVIKSFLGQLYGSEFSNLFVDIDKDQEEGKHHIKPLKTEGVRNGESQVKVEAQALPKLLQVPNSKPPPLQRFNMPANGSQPKNSSKLAGGMGTMGSQGVVAGEKKVEKFHRNFLSMRSLKSSPPSFKNGVSTISTIGNGSLSISKIAIAKKPTNENRNGMLESPKNVGGTGKLHMKYKADAGVNGDDEENYNEVDETGGMEEECDYYSADPQYEENADVSGDYDEVEDNPIPQGYQQDDTIYEENFGVDDDLDDFDVNGTNYFQNLPPSSLITTIGAQPATSKKANGRRVSYPVPSSSNPNDESIDKDSSKNCKVCHEEVPAFSLFTHVINTHYQGQIPTCGICNKQFTYRQGLISHMRYHDAGKYDKACSYCGKRFIRRSDVIIHERRLHTGERPYHCPVPNCNQGFVRRYCLLTHVKTNHGEPYMTQIKAQTNRRKSS